MPATFTHKPAKEQRKSRDTAASAPCPAADRRRRQRRRQLGNQHRGPRELLLRIRFFVFSALAADMLFFAVMVMLFSRARPARTWTRAPMSRSATGIRSHCPPFSFSTPRRCSSVA